MNKDQEQQKWHVCRFCEQRFSNGKKLGGHMRGHLALISASREKSVQESINGEKGVDLFDKGDQVIKKSQSLDKDCGIKKGVQENDQDDDDDEMVNKSQQEMDVDQGFYGTDANNVYVLRENPKRSWRVSNPNSSKSNSDDEYNVFCKQCGKGFQSSKALAAHMRCHSSKESIKITTVCETCGKAFDSMKALYGHMRCHSLKRSQPLDDESSKLSLNDDHSDGLAANPMRKKRSYARYKNRSFNSDHISSTSLSSSDDDFDVEVEGAICLMMLSRGVRNLDGVKLVISNQEADFAFSSDYNGYSPRNVDFEVSVDGSMEFCKFKNKSKVGLEKDLIFSNGSGQIDTGRVGSTLVKYKSIKKPKSCDPDTDAVVDSKISLEVKKKSKEHICSTCFKEFRCSQALGSHKRIHLKTESKAMARDHNVDIDTLDLDFDGGIDYGNVEFKLRWVQSKIEWDL